MSYKQATRKLDTHNVKLVNLGKKPRASTPVDDADDDTPVSNEETDDDGELVAAPDYGEAGPPPDTPLDRELEAVKGHRKNQAGKGFRERVQDMGQMEIEVKRGEVHLLDAWYGEFAHPGVSVVLQQLEVARTMAEAVSATDDGVLITDTRAYPWRCVCALNITAADGSVWIGTGWLAGSRTVITAGHCVYMHSHGGWVRQIQVIPGGNQDQQPYGASIATRFRSVKGWARKQKRSHNYGAIILPGEDAPGVLVGFFGFISLRDLELKGCKVNLAGYPGDKPEGTQWYHVRVIDEVTPRTLVYSFDMAGGQSGTPVWRLKRGERHVVGIHTTGDSAGNSAVRISEPVFNNISLWKR